MHDMEDMRNGPAREDEWELGREPDLRELLDRSLHQLHDRGDNHWVSSKDDIIIHAAAAAAAAAWLKERDEENRRGGRAIARDSNKKCAQ